MSLNLENLTKKIFSKLKNKAISTLAIPALVLGMAGCQDVNWFTEKEENNAPVLTRIGDKIFTVEDTVRIYPKATDQDGDKITFEYTFPLNQYGFWKTQLGDEGWYPVTVSAHDGKGGVDSEEFNIFINPLPDAPINIPPTLDFISDVHIYEGDFVDLNPTASDQDNDPLDFSFSGPLNKDGEWQTTLKDCGTYTTTVTVNDRDGGTASQNVIINVYDHPSTTAPVLYHIKPIVVNKKDLVKITPQAEDPNNTKLYFQYGYPLDSNGEWQTTEADVGEHIVTVTVHDKKNNKISNTDFQDVKIIVKDPKLFFFLEDEDSITRRYGGNIYCIDPDGLNKINLTEYLIDIPDVFADFDLTPDMKKMVYAARTYNNSIEIYFMHFSSAMPSSEMKVTQNRFDEREIAISPNGEKVIYNSLGDICIVNINGSENYDLTLGTGNSERDPKWSPNGEKIYYLSGKDLMVMDAPYGWYKRKLNTTPVDNYNISPDGKQIVYSTFDATKICSCLEIMSSSGKHQRHLVGDIYSRENNFCWSPDSQKIAFTKINGKKEIYVINADGTDLVNLTQNPAANFNPVWSVDGKKIAFSSTRNNSNSIYIMDSDGLNQTKLHEKNGERFYKYFFR